MTTLSDRFSGVGYKEEVDFYEGLEIVSKMDEVDGVGFWGPEQVPLDNCLDVIVGAVNPLDFIEAVYWLHRYDFDGWCGLDRYPFKNNAYDAATESVAWVRGFEGLIEKIGMNEIGSRLENDDPKRALSKIREAAFDFKVK